MGFSSNKDIDMWNKPLRIRKLPMNTSRIIAGIVNFATIVKYLSDKN
jgi:hypothetical protein